MKINLNLINMHILGRQPTPGQLENLLRYIFQDPIRTLLDEALDILEQSPLTDEQWEARKNWAYERFGQWAPTAEEAARDDDKEGMTPEDFQEIVEAVREWA